jgi:hypothetical protein
MGMSTSKGRYPYSDFTIPDEGGECFQYNFCEDCGQTIFRMAKPEEDGNLTIFQCQFDPVSAIGIAESILAHYRQAAPCKTRRSRR